MIHHIQELKRRRHNEHIDGGDSRSLIAQETAPSRLRPSDSSHHVLGDRRLADINSELEDLAMDTWRAPQRVSFAHLPDQVTDLASRSRPVGGGPLLICGAALSAKILKTAGVAVRLATLLYNQ